MKQLLLLLLVVTMAGNTLSAQTKDEKAVAEVVESLRKAMVDADKPMLEKLAAAELSYGHSSGAIQDKAAFVEAIASGKSDFVTIDLTDQTIKIAGNTAIVRHVLTATTSDNGKPNNVKIAVLLVWQKQGGAWKLLARQAVKI
jgi:ketosteroid isomerase-like protein